MEKYKVWTDNESEVYVPAEFFFTLDEACNYACKTAHKYDNLRLLVLHVDNKDTGETIETYESLIRGINY